MIAPSRRILTGWILSAAIYGQAAIAQELPPSTSRPNDQQRLSELVALIEGQNSLQARQTGVREMLRQGWPETPRRLAAILTGAAPAARIAVASTLAELPQHLDPAYAEPLMTMLGDTDAVARRAAMTALAAFRDGGIASRLRTLMLDPQAPQVARLAAVETLALTPQREALAALVDALVDPSTPVAQPALAALEQASGLDFNDDPAEALKWWTAERGLSSTEWQSAQIQRLVSQNRRAATQLQTVESRLSKSLRDYYLRVPEADRPTVLTGYLGDTLSAVRRVGLELIRSEGSEGKSPPTEIVTAVRALLADGDDAVRAAAVRTVAGLRESSDGDRFIEMLSREHNPDVRLALVNGLGYVGGVSAVEALLSMLKSADDACSIEAATALGRMAERSALAGAAAEPVTEALLKRFDQTRRDRPVLRERLLWALGRLGDRRCGSVFVAALDPAEAVAVRQAAVRGIAVLDRPELTDALVPAAADADVAVRKTAVEAIAQRATTDVHVNALWSRLVGLQEPDDAVRDAAWRGILRVLATRPFRELDTWIARLPEDSATRGRRIIELLQLAEKALATDARNRADLGRVRARIAAQRATLGMLDEAIADYGQSLDDLRAADAPHAAAVALDLLRLAVSTDRYDERIAAVLTAGASLDADALWSGIEAELDRRLTRDPDNVDRVLVTLTQLQSHPPASMPARLAGSFDQIFRRARAQREALDAGCVRKALEKLRADPNDAAARAAITQLGARAAPGLGDALKALVAEDTAHPAFERALHDLLKSASPAWPGYPADADRAGKLKALEAAAPQV